jgi:FkbM family methyltransferase
VFALRDSEIRVALRTGTRDGDIFDEIFVVSRVYEPPAPVADRLDAVQRPLRVLDLGGNIGLFGAYVFDRFGDAEVTSVEPDPANAAILRRCISCNGLHDRWRLVQACAGTRAGTVALEAGRFADSRVVDGAAADAIEVPQLDVFALVSDLDVLKIDIEGSEWPIFADPRFAELDTQVLVVEWHDYLAPRDPRESAIEALTSAGFVVIPSPPSDIHGFGTIWGWRPATCLNRGVRTIATRDDARGVFRGPSQPVQP